jgi:purine-nucleoside phosphorylase
MDCQDVLEGRQTGHGSPWHRRFTGKAPDGSLVSVMASGMGMPSIGIYCHELYTSYGVEAIIRIGTCGAYQKGIKLKDLIIAEGACTNSNWMGEHNLYDGTFSAIADFDLLSAAVEAAKAGKFPYHVGNIIVLERYVL